MQDPDGCHQIQPQERKVRQVVLAQGFVAKMCMNHANAAQRALSEPISGEIRQEHFAAVAHDDILHDASTVDENRDLPSDFMGQTRAKPRQLPRDYGILGDSPAIHVLKAAKMTRLQPCEIAVWRWNSFPPSARSRILQVPVGLRFKSQTGGAGRA